jgi:rubrerythrin
VEVSAKVSIDFYKQIAEIAKKTNIKVVVEQVKL